MGLIYYIGTISGLIEETVVMLLSVVVMWYLVDIYGDYLFTDKKHIADKNKIAEVESRNINIRY
jgi:hypothetical protein